MTPKQRKKSINKWLGKGFRYSYHYDSGIGDLDTSLIFRMLSTSERGAAEAATRTLGSGKIVVYNLTEELEKL